MLIYNGTGPTALFCDQILKFIYMKHSPIWKILTRNKTLNISRLHFTILPSSMHYVIYFQTYFVNCHQDSIHQLPHIRYNGLGWSCVRKEKCLYSLTQFGYLSFLFCAPNILLLNKCFINNDHFGQKIVLFTPPERSNVVRTLDIDIYLSHLRLP